MLIVSLGLIVVLCLMQAVFRLYDLASNTMVFGACIVIVFCGVGVFMQSVLLDWFGLQQWRALFSIALQCVVYLVMFGMSGAASYYLIYTKYGK